MLLALLAVAATAAGAQADPQCSPAAPVPALVVTDPAGGGALFATHLLRVRARAPDGGPEFVRSLSAPGARFDPEAETLFSDTAGQLPVSAVVSSVEPTGDGCDATVTTTLSLLPPRPWRVGALFKPARSQRSSSTRPLEFAFRVTPPSAGADLRPVTARARVVRRLRFPGRGTKAVRRIFDLRPGDAHDDSSGGGCGLICGSRRDPGVEVRRSGGGFAVEVGPLPISDPPQATGGRRIGRPYGVDIELLQGGRRIARLRVAGRCDGFAGLSSALIRCPKPKLSRKLG